MTMEDFAKKFPLNISPVYDENPFFYNFDKTLSSPFRQLYGLLILGVGIVIWVMSIKAMPGQVKTGLASLVGSILTMIVGIGWGFTEAVIAGGGLYLLVAL